MGNEVPVIAIDGPSASGKGTVASLVAKTLGFHYLDSGLLYRLTALAAMHANLDFDDAPRVAQLAGALDVQFVSGETMLAGVAVNEALRDEACGAGASRVAQYGAVREALLARQRAFLQLPGLVADGRDMGSVVFPNARLKVYLTAEVEIRAQRRFKQLMEKEMPVNMQALLINLRERDLRDSTRAAAPLLQQPDAVLLDTSDMTIVDAVDFVLEKWRNRCPVD